MAKPQPDPSQVQEAYYNAFLDMMDAAGHYPTTRSDIIDAIQRGANEAFMRLMDPTGGGYPMTRDDILNAIRDGVREATANHLDTHGLPPTT